MAITTEKGNYRGLEIDDEHGSVNFTYQCTLDTLPKLIIRNRQTKEEVFSYTFRKADCIGRLCSVKVCGLDFNACEYAFFEGDTKKIDPYARLVYGREHFGETPWEREVQEENTHEPNVYVTNAQERYAREIWYGFPEKRKERTLPPVFISEAERVIYKLHVRNFSMEQKGLGKKKGTFHGVAASIPYFKELGINTIEFMPVYEFDEWDELAQPEVTQYADYATWKALRAKEDRKIGGKQKTKAEQRAKEEKNVKEERKQPVEQSIRIEDLGRKKEQIINDIEKRFHKNCWGYKAGNYFAPKAGYSCGKPDAEFAQMVNALHTAGIAVILEFYFPKECDALYEVEVLRHWVLEYGVDAFHLQGEGVALDAVVKDPLLAGTDLYASGFYPEHLANCTERKRLFVYNEEFLYPMRKMLVQREQNMGMFLEQFEKSHPAEGFVHYLTNYNGFTMWDLFSYEKKHNEENGWNNCDGNDYNYSTNCAYEGQTTKKAVLALRRKLMRNAFCMLLLQRAVPLLYGGDEFGNSQDGNNNAYGMDSKVAYVNWAKRKKEAALFSFVKKLLAFRKAHPVLMMSEEDEKGVRVESGLPRVSYHTESAWLPYVDGNRTSIGILYCGEYAKKADGTEDDMLYLAFHFGEGEKSFALPIPKKGYTWEKVIDTESDEGFLTSPKEVLDTSVVVSSRSVCVFVGKKR